MNPVLFAPVVMGGACGFDSSAHNRREPAWWDGLFPRPRDRRPADVGGWAFEGGSGVDCGADGGAAAVMEGWKLERTSTRTQDLSDP